MGEGGYVVQMRELRVCPVSGAMVLLNDAWPDAPAPAKAGISGHCAACGLTGRVLSQSGAARAIPHPVPALGVEGQSEWRRDGVGVRRDAVGAHELCFGRHGLDEVEVLAVAAARIADLRRDARLRDFRLLRPGHDEHGVWQLFALPYESPRGNVMEWLHAERAQGLRLVEDRGGAVAVAAFAPLVPFEVWVLPGEAVGLPEGAEAVLALAQRVRARMARLLGGPLIHAQIELGQPWRVVLRPETEPLLLTGQVGLAGHGVFPERAAALLR